MLLNLFHDLMFDVVFSSSTSSWVKESRRQDSDCIYSLWLVCESWSFFFFFLELTIMLKGLSSFQCNL
uniref:Putative ovule protein n=1 Tax=Solanum chacoense TaxID=4108 RepID=A0A0V0HZB0_SOLCH